MVVVNKSFNVERRFREIENFFQTCKEDSHYGEKDCNIDCFFTWKNIRISY